MGKKIIFNIIVFFLIVSIISINLVSSEFGFDNPDLPRVTRDAPAVITFNNNTGAVNTSDFWDNLNTPADITTFLLNTGDTATGNYSFDTNVLFIDSSNDRIGIGTTSPNKLLELDIKSSGDGLRIFRSDSGNSETMDITTSSGFWYIDTHNDLIMRANSQANQLVLDGGTGNIGIGTVNPLYELDVNGTIRADEYRISDQFYGGLTDLSKGIISTVGLQGWSDVFMGKAVSNVEYWDGDSWEVWAQSLNNLFDNNVATGVTIPTDRSKFRFTIVGGAYFGGGMLNIYQEWVTGGLIGYDYLVEYSLDGSTGWGTQGNGTALSGKYQMYDSLFTHRVEGYYRITIDFGTLANPQNLRWIKALTSRLSYGVRQGLPLFTSYDKFIGIGIISPTQLLHLRGNSPNLAIGNLAETDSGIQLYDSNTGLIGQGVELVYGSGDNKFKIITHLSNTINALTIDSSARVGIGTTTPQNTLNVIGDLNVSENATFGQDVIIAGTIYGGSPVKIAGGLNIDGGNVIINSSYNFTSGYYTTLNEIGSYSDELLITAQGAIKYMDESETVDVMFLNVTSGYVGIGTATPGDKLHILDTRTDPGSAALYVQQTGVNPGGTMYGAFIEKTGASRTNVGGYFSATGATNNYGLIVPDGRFGVGTSFPDSIFHIKANIAGTVGSHPAGQIIIQNPADSVTSNVVITAYESDGNGDPDQQLWYLGSSSSSNSNIIFLNRRNALLQFGTNDNTQMTILGNGNVGIGTTSPDSKLQINGNFTSETDSTDSIGSSAIRWLKGWFDSLDITGDVNIGGDLVLDTVQAKDANGLSLLDSTGAWGLYVKAGGIIDTPQQPRARVYTTAGQTIGTGAWTNISWASETFDTQVMHDTSTNNERIKVTVGGAGVYMITASITFSAVADGIRGIRIQKNGAGELRRVIVPAVPATLDAEWHTVQVNDIFHLAEDDYIIIAGWQDSGGDMTLLTGADRNHFAMIKLT